LVTVVIEWIYVFTIVSRVALLAICGSWLVLEAGPRRDNPVVVEKHRLAVSGRPSLHDGLGANKLGQPVGSPRRKSKTPRLHSKQPSSRTRRKLTSQEKLDQPP
jgi:hypothetical protein